MSKTNTYENELLLLVFNNTNMANVGDATGLRGSSAAGSFYLSLHSADPGEAGDQTTNEVTYTSYARVAVARSGAGFVVTGNSISPAAAVNFPLGTGGAIVQATHWGVGTAASGAGKLLYKGPVNPSVATGNSQTPGLTTATAITEE